MSPDDPTNDPDVEGDPYKTLFVARIVSIVRPIAIQWDLSAIFKGWPHWHMVDLFGH